MFVRHDWTVFRNINTLSQKAGVPQRRLRRLVVKELVDNALDATGGKNCTLTKVARDIYEVSDDGDGIPGLDHEIADLFSIKRPLTSSKLLRLPTRGALGNGLRVVVGCVLATGGSLTVTTRGYKYSLVPQDDGTTTITDIEQVDDRRGTTIRVHLPDLPEDVNDLWWGNMAIAFRYSKLYSGPTNPHWYDSSSFFELMRAAGDRSPADFIAFFDGWAGENKKASVPDAVAGLPGRCVEFSREDADVLLGRLREKSKPVTPKNIGGGGSRLSQGYALRAGYIELPAGRGAYGAKIPYVVEVWADRAKPNVAGKAEDEFTAFANGTPVAADTEIKRQKPTEIAIWGCGLAHRFSVARSPAKIYLNIVTPHIPITNDGKSPDFLRYCSDISSALKAATSKLKSAVRREDQPDSQRDIILAAIPKAIKQAGGNGRYRYSLRQLFYAVRPSVLVSHGGKELNYEYFASIITKYENDNGELPGMYRDPRGNLYHPHTGETIPIGTIAVEQYKRPAWTFNKVLYCEKEGLVSMLVADGWPERNDCALLSSKGFASRAVRDVIDLMGGNENDSIDAPLTFFCIHDADGSGSLIYQSLVEETKARAGRQVGIVNLGLDPWEAIEMGLEVEAFSRKSDRKQPVARYIRNANQAPPEDYDDWSAWLQSNRVELNAMTSPQFVAWLNEKLLPYHSGKVVPPERVLRREADGLVEAELRRRMTEKILLEAGIDDKIKQAKGKVSLSKKLSAIVTEGLENNPTDRWSSPLASTVREAVEASGVI